MRLKELLITWGIPLMCVAVFASIVLFGKGDPYRYHSLQCGKYQAIVEHYNRCIANNSCYMDVVDFAERATAKRKMLDHCAEAALLLKGME